MVELIEPIVWAASESLRREVFEFRHSVFVNNLNWDVTSHDGWEFDEYDALLPYYMIKRGLNGNLRAVWRLLPTTGPYMLRNTFPQLLGEWTAPRSENILEISRFAIDPSGSGADGILEFSNISGEMICALGEFGIDRGITEVVAVFDYRFFLVFRDLGTTLTWIGKPVQIGHSKAIAASFEVSKQALTKILQKTSLLTPVLSQSKIERRAA